MPSTPLGVRQYLVKVKTEKKFFSNGAQAIYQGCVILRLFILGLNLETETLYLLVSNLIILFLGLNYETETFVLWSQFLRLRPNRSGLKH
jgi:hypothetical protein